MRRLILVTILTVTLVLMMSMLSSAQVLIQINLERDNDATWVTLAPEHLTYEEVDGVRVVYDELPFPRSVCFTDIQEWYVPADDWIGFNVARFKASEVGIDLPGEYFCRVGSEGFFGPAADRTILSPPAPVPK